MRVLVTGGAGFIGSHTAARLVREGHEVRVLDNLETGDWRNLAPVWDELDPVEGDIRDPAAVARAMRHCDAVLHAAALPSVPRSVEHPMPGNITNITGTLNVLLAARDAGVRRLVFASSSSVYGSSLELPKSESGPALPMAPYAVAKLAGEGYCRSFWLLHGVETVTLRYFNVFGPRQREGHTYSGLLPRLFRAALAGATPTIFGDGEQSRDFTYVDNVVDANMLALETPGIGGEIFNVGCGERITVNRIVEALGDLLGQELRPEYREPRPGDMRHTQADLRLVRERLGYRPAIGFAEGLARTFEHHLTTLGRDARSAVA